MNPKLESVHQLIVDVFIHLFDSSDHRKHMAPHHISSLLAPLINPYFSAKNLPRLNERWRLCAHHVVSLLKSWTGLIILVNYPFGVRSIVQTLTIRNFHIIVHVRNYNFLEK
jgi:hypothetical protein